MGDSWDSKGGPDSNHVWLPIAVDASSKRLTLEYHAQWRIDTALVKEEWGISMMVVRWCLEM